MSDEIATVAEAAMREFLDARDEFAVAQKTFAEAEARYKASCADAAAKCQGVAFQGKKGYFFFSKVRGEGNYAIKPYQATWTVEGKTVVKVKDRL